MVCIVDVTACGFGSGVISLNNVKERAIGWFAGLGGEGDNSCVTATDSRAGASFEVIGTGASKAVWT